jgi:hypothetical protein
MDPTLHLDSAGNSLAGIHHNASLLLGGCLDRSVPVRERRLCRRIEKGAKTWAGDEALLAQERRGSVTKGYELPSHDLTVDDRADLNSCPTEILKVLASFTSVVIRRSFSPRLIAPVNDPSNPLS